MLASKRLVVVFRIQQRNLRWHCFLHAQRQLQPVVLLMALAASPYIATTLYDLPCSRTVRRCWISFSMLKIGSIIATFSSS